ALPSAGRAGAPRRARRRRAGRTAHARGRRRAPRAWRGRSQAVRACRCADSAEPARRPLPRAHHVVDLPPRSRGAASARLRLLDRARRAPPLDQGAARAGRLRARQDPPHVVSRPTDVLIIGGGLAGLSAATLLAERGVHATLLEGRGSLGGRAQSFTHAGTGDELDTGQHAMMGCYVEMFRYLDRLGTRSLVRLQDALAVELASPSGERARVASPSIPAPWHLAVALLRHGMLSLREKALTLRVMGDVRARWDDPALDALTVEEWL